MKLRIDVEKKSYEVNVEFLEDAHNGHRNWQPAELVIPESVTRHRPTVKLLEDTFCRSPIAGRISAVLAIDGQAMRKNEAVLIIEAMKMEIQICPAVDGVLETIRRQRPASYTMGQTLLELS